MAYTFMMVPKTSTTRRVLSFTMQGWLFFVLLITILSSPFWTYFIAYKFLVPKRLSLENSHMEQTLRDLRKLRIELQETRKQKSKLEKFLSEERAQKAEVETRVAIAETARSESDQRVQALEQDVYQLKRNLRFYEAFLKPATDTGETAQCFNIKLNYNEEKKSLGYGINFLKSDKNKSKKKLNLTVKFRMLSGGAMLEAGEDAQDAVVTTRDITFSKDVRLTGMIENLSLKGEGLQVLDIKAYNPDGSVAAHCWKPI